MRKIPGLTALLLTFLLLLTAAGAQAEKSVLMTFAGDCTLGGEGSVSKTEESFDAFAEKYGYDYFFANFRELFEKDDITVVNLEGVLSDSAFMEKKGKTDGSGQIPFGPFLAVAAPVMYLWGQDLLNLYVKFVFGE